MELDKRIIEGKKPLDCFDIDIAKQFARKDFSVLTNHNL